MTEKSNEALRDMDVESTTFDTAKSVISEVLISESCVENLISRIDSYIMPPSEKLCDKPQPSSVSIPDQETDQQPDQQTDQLVCQDKEPVDQTSNSSRCSMKVVTQNNSQDSTKSTLIPVLSQQSSSSIPLSMKGDFPGSDKRIKKSLNYQQKVNNVPEASVMKHIKVIHNHLNFSLKNSKAINQADKILLRNAKEHLFSLKQNHAVLCNSIKADFNRQIPSERSRQILKKKINLLQKRQHKLLLLFQEHNTITKKMKMLNTDQSKQLEIALKQWSLPTSKLMDNPPLGLGKTGKISNTTVTAFDDTQSESLSTVYSIRSFAPSQNIKSKENKDLNCFELSLTQESMSESFKTPNKRIKPSLNNFPLGDSNPVFPSERNQTQCYNAPSRDLLLNNQSAVCDWNAENSTNTLADFSLNSSPKHLTDYQQFTATPVGTVADFTKANSQTQQSFDNSSPSEVSVCQEAQNLENTSQLSQSIPVHSKDDLLCSPRNVLTLTDKHAQYEMKEFQKQISEESKNNFTDKNNLDTWSDEDEENHDDASNQISGSLTHLTLIDDEELIPLYSILPSCQNTDTFGNINFPKFLWDGFHKWP